MGHHVYDDVPDALKISPVCWGDCGTRTLECVTLQDDVGFTIVPCCGAEPCKEKIVNDRREARARALAPLERMDAGPGLERIQVDRR
jgi:hypothetical protein